MRVSRPAVLRLLITSLFVAWATSSIAEPPPYPRFKVTNRTNQTVTGSFSLSYLADDTPTINGTRTSTTARLDNLNLAPGQSAERSLPNRVEHQAVSNEPYWDGAGPVDCTFMLGSERVRFTNVPTCHHINQGTYISGNRYVYLTIDKGSTSLTARDYYDVYIDIK